MTAVTFSRYLEVVVLIHIKGGDIYFVVQLMITKP